jgi:hypothetical protein
VRRAFYQNIEPRAERVVRYIRPVSNAGPDFHQSRDASKSAETTWEPLSNSR